MSSREKEFFDKLKRRTLPSFLACMKPNGVVKTNARLGHDALIGESVSLATNDAVDLTILGLGIIAGMRTFSAPGIACLKLSKDAAGPDLGPWLKLASSRPVVWFWVLLASGEMVADKLPGMPNRTDPLSLVGRIASGVFCGALVSRSAKRNAIRGALLGALAAASSTFLTFHFRQKLAAKIPDPLAAVAEDAVVVACGRAILNNAGLVR